MRDRFQLKRIAGSVVLALCVGVKADASSDNTCAERFNADSSGHQFTFNEITSFDLNKSLINLSRLRLNLDLAQASGEKSVVLTALTADYNIKEAELLQYLQKNKVMTPAELRVQIKQEVSRQQSHLTLEQNRQQALQEQASKARKIQEGKILDIAINGSRATFHPLEPGSFKMGGEKKVLVTLTKPFDLMATSMTQTVWKQIAELVNERFSASLNLDPSSFKGDLRPVESVSFTDVQNFIQGLNALSQAREPRINEIIPSHKDGDVYRLPTEAEWEFVVRGRGKLSSQYHFGKFQNNIGDYAWFDRNSNGSTQDVALKLPLMIDGKDFYDMHGNVSVWVSDWYKLELSGGVDPQGPVTGTMRLVRGGPWYGQGEDLRSDKRGFVSPAYKSNDVGLRLARTR